METNEWIPAINQLGHGAHAQMTLAYACFANGDHAGTIRHCHISKKLNPNFPRPFLLLGWTFFNLGKLDNAMEALREALRIDESLTDARLLEILILMETEQDDEAMVKCHDNIKYDGENAYFHFALGHLFSRQGRYEEAAESLKNAVFLNPQLSDARQLLASCYLHLDKEKSALSEVEAALQLNPISARMRLLLGRMYFGQGDYLSALSEFREATNINPRMADAHYQAGQSYFSTEQYSLALLELRISLFIHPNYPEALHLLGKVYFFYKRYKLAIEHYQAALNLKIKFPEARCDLGDAFVASNQLPEAIREYRQAIQFHGLTCEDGEKYEAAKLFVQAITAYRLALGLTPELLVSGTKVDRVLGDSHNRREGRRQNRYKVKLSVGIEKENEKLFMAETLDISQQGLLIECDQTIEVGTEIKVLLSAPQAEDQIPLIGTVVHVDSKSPGSLDKRFGVRLSSGLDKGSSWENLFSDF